MQNIICNLCGENKYDTLFWGKDRLLRIDGQEFSIVKCVRCSLVYVNPQPTEQELQPYYPSSYGPYGSSDIFSYSLSFSILRRVYSFLKGIFWHTKIPSNSERKLNDVLSYLDFGCGGGIHLESVRNAHPNWDLRGLDNNPVACLRTKERGFKVFCGSVFDVQLPKDYFDIVNMSQVIEHLNDPHATLLRVHMSMKKGGKLVVSTPNFKSFSSLIFKKYWYALDTPRHLYLFDPKTLGAMLQNAGFSVTKIDYSSDPKIFIRSMYYVLGREDMRIHPLLWKLLMPASRFTRFLSKSSVMTVVAEKV